MGIVRVYERFIIVYRCMPFLKILIDGIRNSVYNSICVLSSGIEVAITSLTRNQVVPFGARGFESHPLRKSLKIREDFQAFFEKLLGKL